MGRGEVTEERRAAREICCWARVILAVYSRQEGGLVITGDFLVLPEEVRWKFGRCGCDGVFLRHMSFEEDLTAVSI